MDLQAFFTEGRDILDNHHDRRERIIKVSRDITALSKKMIFALHRVAQQQPSNSSSESKYKDSEQKQQEIMVMFRTLSVDVQGSNYFRYARSFSGAFEEFASIIKQLLSSHDIEAIAFHHFLLHQSVITKEQVDDYFKEKDTNVQWLNVTSENYILGLADFTGELMRNAIHVVSTGKYEQAMVICKLLRKIGIDFELITPHFPLLNKKMGALNASIKKVENACYTFQIRGSEYPKEMYLSIIKDHQDQYEQNSNST